VSFPFVVGRAVLAELGEHALHEIARNIWPVDCQACGRPFEGQRPSLAVDDLGAVVTAALYHRTSRSSVFNTSGAMPGPAGPYLSYSTAAADVTVELDNGSVAELPLVIVNPSLEQVFLHRDRFGFNAFRCLRPEHFHRASLPVRAPWCADLLERGEGLGGRAFPADQLLGLGGACHGRRCHAPRHRDGGVGELC
jgi:hypothetical protein